MCLRTFVVNQAIYSAAASGWKSANVPTFRKEGGIAMMKITYLILTLKTLTLMLEVVKVILN